MALLYSYNRLVYAATKDLTLAGSRECLERRVGKTTGELLQLIGYCNSHPNERVNFSRFISDYFSHTAHYRFFLVGECEDLLHKLEFVGYKLSRTDMTLEFDLFGTYKKAEIVT